MDVSAYLQLAIRILTVAVAVSAPYIFVAIGEMFSQ